MSTGTFPTSTEPHGATLDARSRRLRQGIVRTLHAGGRGHLASAFSVVEILRVLYDDILSYDPREPQSPGRDRCILSKGHGCVALYVLLAEKGFFPSTELERFCRADGLLGGHPEHRIPGVEACTGSLGHGLSLGVGMALAGRLRDDRWHTFVVLGDGECNEGSIWEAAMSAAKHRLDRLTVLVDYNKQQSYASTSEVLELEPFADKWRSFGFSVAEVDGHDVEALRRTLSAMPLDPGRPNAVICHTVKGRGVSFVERDLAWHHRNKMPEDELGALLDELAVDE